VVADIPESDFAGLSRASDPGVRRPVPTDPATFVDNTLTRVALDGVFAD
jgi:hypothetical protein